MNTTPVKLWIDDDDWSGTRNPPAGWTWAKTSAEALAVLTSETVVEVSFDHDLGLTADCKDCGAVAHNPEETGKCCNYCYHDDTTRAVVLHMAENDSFPPICRVHTANRTGKEYLEGVINRYGPGVTNGPAQKNI